MSLNCSLTKQLTNQGGITMLGLYVPEIVDIGEEEAIAKYKEELVGDKVWAPLDLQEWLEDQGLGDYEALEYTNLLIDYMLENDLGYEYGGITPWCGEGYSLY
jgi:hypothetical protein